MARFRSLKASLRTILESPDWQAQAPAIVATHGRQALGPLFSFLLLGGEMKWRAAVVMGQVASVMASAHMEDARVLMRRFMWHMNEESGNIGWGIPEAMAECLAADRRLATEYHRILISYIRDMDRDSNFCDHAALRRSCYWAVGRLAQAWPDLASGAVEPLVEGLQDEDAICRGNAAWALGAYCMAVKAAGEGYREGGKHVVEAKATAIPPELWTVACERLRALQGDATEVEFFEEGAVRHATVGEVAAATLACIA